MSDPKQYKELNVTLTEQDVKKFARTTTRKRRAKGGALAPADVKAANAETVATELATGIVPPVIIIPGAPAAVPSIDTRGQSWIPSANTNTVPGVEKQVTPAPGPTAADVGLTVGPPMTGGGSVYSGKGTIKLSAKKNSLHTTPATTPGAPRILPTKRKSGGAPAIVTTRKKERLVISTSPVKTPQNTHSTKTRKFRERRISITVRPSGRAAAKRIKEKVDVLPIGQVRRALLRKGVLKPGNSKTPEPMLRAMLKDYLLLHNAD